MNFQHLRCLKRPVSVETWSQPAAHWDLWQQASRLTRLSSSHLAGGRFGEEKGFSKVIQDTFPSMAMSSPSLKVFNTRDPWAWCRGASWATLPRSDVLLKAGRCSHSRDHTCLLRPPSGFPALSNFSFLLGTWSSFSL